MSGLEGAQEAGEEMGVEEMVMIAINSALSLNGKMSEFVYALDRQWAVKVDSRRWLQVFVDGDINRPVVEFSGSGKIESVVGGYGPIFRDPEKVREIFEAVWPGLFS